MKLISKTTNKQGGNVIVVPEDADDLWTLYNLISKNDEITLKTYRNIRPIGSSGVPIQGAPAQKKLITLTLNVLELNFVASERELRIKGRTLNALPDVPLGSHHTANVIIKESIKIHKDIWDSHDDELIDSSCSLASKAEVGAIVLEEGVSHTCLITDSMTILRNKIEKSIPKKRRGDSSAHDKALNTFLINTSLAAIRTLDLINLKAIIIASPGTLANQLMEKIFIEIDKTGNKDLIRCKSKFLTAVSSTGYLQGLEEILKSPTIKKQLSDTKVQRNVALFDEFTKHLNLDDCKAFYGEKEVEKALEIGGAIKVLLITDTLFKNDDVNKRKHYINLVENVKNDGGEVSIFSSLHDSGKQLDQLTGIAVILNYPVPDLDDDDDSDDVYESD
ncbi:Translation factor pelota [Pichia californica]|uniref:Protein DOM34 homolog n=1 Tax=Pichia californica TaxID=460514 RepID=A0A9P6WN25_9ASCO|nr:Translation factor pelota [[Candida] californica]KAG0690159.1 Translation factor pelota [[Candida] californica]